MTIQSLFYQDGRRWLLATGPLGLTLGLGLGLLVALAGDVYANSAYASSANKQIQGDGNTQGGNSSQYRDVIERASEPMPLVQRSLFLDIAQAGNRLVAVGARGHILYSDDTGRSWQQARVATQVQLNALYFVDHQRGWAVGEDSVILVTRDGGLSWSRQFDDRDAEMKGPLLDLHFKDANQGFAIGVFNKIYRTTDGGKHWHSWQEQVDNPDEWHLFSMVATSAGSIYLASEAGLLFRSQDKGASFSAIQTDHDGSFHHVLARKGAQGEDLILLSGVGGKLFASVDSGRSWRELDSQTEAGLAGGTWLADGSAVLVGADGILLHVAADFSTVTKTQRDNGLPLSSALATDQGDLLLTGLAGIQQLKVAEVTDHD